MLLAGRYRLERELGRGGMGSVWLAEQVSLGSHVAVKLLSSQLEVADAAQRFFREAQLAAQLNNPHIVKLFDHGVENGLAFLVMELLEGETLAARLARERTLTPQLTATVLLQVAQGVSAAHRAQIVHRDLKPENVFLVAGSHQLLVKVLDFGIAKTLQRQDVANAATGTGMRLGTLPYMSPEQIADSKRVGAEADTWSLGVMAHECLLGRLPFAAENVGALVYAICQQEPPVPSTQGPVPAGFDDWFRQCLAHNPGDRFPSLEQAAAVLGRLCGEPPSAQANVSPATLPTRVCPPDMKGEPTGAPVSSSASAGSTTVREVVGGPRRWLALAVVVFVVCVIGVRLLYSAAPANPPGGVLASSAPSEPGTLLAQKSAKSSPSAVPSVAAPQPTVTLLPSPSVSATARRRPSPAAAGSPAAASSSTMLPLGVSARPAARSPSKVKKASPQQSPKADVPPLFL